MNNSNFTQPTCKAWRVLTNDSRGYRYVCTTSDGRFLYEASDWWTVTCWARETGYRLLPKFHRASFYQAANMTASKAGRPYKPTHPAAAEPTAGAMSGGRREWWQSFRLDPSI